MDSSGSQQKKPRKPYSVSRRSVGAPAVASARIGGPRDAAPGTGGGTSGHQTPSALLAGMSLGGSSPGSSKWLYPLGGFVNSLQMPYPYASQHPENFHFVGGTSSRGIPSPNDGTQAHETINVDGDESPEPARTDKRLNWSHEEDVRLRDVKVHYTGVAVRMEQDVSMHMELKFV